MPIPSMMRAITIEGGSGPADALVLSEVPVPQPLEGQVLIRVRAAGINRPDVFQRLGLYPPPPGASDILGLEVAGEVVRGAGRWKVGDRVCALLAGGGYAEYAICDAGHVLPVPDGLSWVEAASLPETIFTVFTNVFEDGKLRAGETLLVHGANSGIGVTAIQMGKAAGARVVATARGEKKTGQARATGADVVIDASKEDFGATLATDGGVDVVLEMVAGDYFAKDLVALKPHGRIVFIAALAGFDVNLPVFQLMQKNAVVTGSTLRARSSAEKARLASAIEGRVWPWVSDGSVRAVIDRTFPLKDAAAAHAYFDAGEHHGKIILEVGE